MVNQPVLKLLQGEAFASYRRSLIVSSSQQLKIKHNKHDCYLITICSFLHGGAFEKSKHSKIFSQVQIYY